jgi:hypothetical protein
MSSSRTIVTIGATAALGLGLAVTAAALPAHAASASPARTSIVRPDSSAGCNYSGAVNEVSASFKHGGETRTIQLWYSSPGVSSNASRCVWAVETGGQPGDLVWIWNRNTGAESEEEGLALPTAGGLVASAEIGDAGTSSHACMVPRYSNGSFGPTTCTSFF